VLHAIPTHTLHVSIRAHLEREAAALSWSTAAEADALAVSLQGLADRLLLPAAAAAEAFMRVEGWKELGYARQSDYARERLDRTSRWLLQRAALGRAARRCPRLAEAVTGDDGRPPIGLVRALAIASVTTPDGVEAWIARAREVGLRQLESDVRRAREEQRAATTGPARRMLRDAARSNHDDGEPDDEPRACVRISMPRAVRAAFDEALDLHRAVSGGETTVASFIEALVAEFRAGTDESIEWDREHRDRPGDVQVAAMRRPGRASRGEREELLERNETGPTGIDCSRHPAFREARSLVASSARLFAEAGRGDASELHDQLRAFVRLEDELRRTLAGLLLAMRDGRFFSARGDAALPFTCIGHYARARLGRSRATAERLVRLAAGLRRHRALARAYDAGRIGTTQASLALRALGRPWVDGEAEAAWVERAERATVRRLRDEVRTIVREAPLRGEHDVRLPPDDASWYASLRRQPGRSFERIVLLGAATGRDSRRWTRLFVHLPRSLADDLRATLDASCRAVARERRDARERATAPSNEPFSDSQGFAAPWMGLMRLLLGFAVTHDPPQSGPRRRGARIYERDGYRCTVPGCTSRANLEDHHVVYRSRGGGDEPENRVTLCRFHHQRGEHGGLIAVRGRAPLGLVIRLGRGRSARRYRNDLTIVSTSRGSGRPPTGALR